MFHLGFSGRKSRYELIGKELPMERNPRLERPAAQPGRANHPKDLKVQVEKRITIHRPVRQVYAFWRNFENLPRFMGHVKSVQVFDDLHSHWAVKGPAGKDVEWDAEITSDRENEFISWTSMEKADVENAGSVSFKPAGAAATEVAVTLAYNPPAGAVGKGVAQLFGKEPGQEVESDLKKFKEILETGF